MKVILFAQPFTLFRRFLLSLLLIIPHVAYSAEPQKHVIGCWYGGFFSCFCAVLNQLDWCEANNKTPAVYWGPLSYYYVEGGYRNEHTNVWEYYFEPVSRMRYEPGDQVYNVYTFTDGPSCRFCWDKINQQTRDYAFYLITKYVKINPIVQQKIDDFSRANMRSNTIGIHLRGTDKKIEEEPVSPEQITAAALTYADSDTQFLLATDEQQLLDRMIALLPGRKIFFYNCYRSDDGTPLHIGQKKVLPAQLGEDVLVEVLLLAQCSMLVHTVSNVSTGVLYFNPYLPHCLVK